MPAGRLIVIEGLDASGKEMQSNFLLSFLLEQGVQAKRVEFPNYKSESSALIKMYLAGEFGQKPDSVNAYAASSFYAVDRYATYKTEMEQFYKAGGVIICDRYTTSNMIHQASKLRLAGERDAFLKWLEEYEYTLLGLPRPDLVIFLDMPVEVSQKLMQGRRSKSDGTDTKDIHEADLEYLARTYHTAEQLAERYHWRKIACSENGQPRGVEAIRDDVVSILIDNRG